MSLIDVCYEQIKDNFWYGIFGDFRLIVDKSSGYFNATKLCASGGKRFDNWLQKKHSKNLLKYYQNLASLNSRRLNSTYFVEPIGTNPVDLLISGTYVREELILNISCWISNEFYDKCCKIIRDFYVQDYKHIQDDRDKLQVKVEELEKSLNKLRLSIVPDTTDEGLINCFVIVQKNKTEYYPYYAIRTQRRNFKKSYEQIKSRYPWCEIIYQKTHDPNSMRLFNLMQEDLLIESNCNDFKCDLSKDEMCNRIDFLYQKLSGA